MSLEWVKLKWKFITSIATGITAITAALVILGIEFPRPAWAGELEAVTKYVAEVDNKITSQQLDDTKLRLYQNIREQNVYTSTGQSVPIFLQNERVVLERQVDELESHLEFLRSQ